jgi:hypothetical protein
MDNTFIEKLNIELEKIFNTTNFKNSDINEELNILVEKFDKSVVPLLETKQEEAEEYYKEREEYSNKIVDPVNEKAKIMVEDIKRDYQQLYDEATVEEITSTVASSYSAKMNLIGESDIDYFILLKPMTIEKVIQLSILFGKYNFKFEKIGNKNDPKNMYYIFNQHIDNVEVELKVRDLDNSSAVVGLHDYLDNKLDQHLKILMTYAKYQLKLKAKEDKSFKGYNILKTLIYNYCFKDIKDAFFLII